MRRNRRFPLISLLLTISIAAGVGYLAFLDADTPQRALQKVGETVSCLANSFQMIGSSIADDGFVFGDTKVSPTATEAPTQPPANEPTSGVLAQQTQDMSSSGDASMPLLVNEDHPLDASYKPENLVNMRSYCDSNVVYIKGSEIEGVREAVDALMIMLRAAIDDGVGNWQINAGYRSFKYQQQVWDNKVYEYRQQGLTSAQARQATAKLVAVPGASEHHTGLAFDVTVPGESFPLTKQSKWLAEHCWEYGFIIRYTEEKQPITKFNAEPWHIRYVGQPHARIMRDQNLCLEEYIEAYAAGI